MFSEDISGVGPLPEPLASSPLARAPGEKPNLTCDLSPITARPTTSTSLLDNNPLASETGKPGKSDESPELGVEVSLS